MLRPSNKESDTHPSIHPSKEVATFLDRTGDAAEAEEQGKPHLIHIVALGALVELSGVVSKQAIESAVKDHVPRGGEEAHLAALSAGYRLGEPQTS